MKLRNRLSLLLSVLLVLSIGIGGAVLAHESSDDARTQVTVLVVCTTLAAVLGILLAAHLTRALEIDAAALMAKRVRELEVAREALLEAERSAAVGKTSAAIAHELRNALNGLGMAIELILEDPSNLGRIGRLRERVLSEIERLRELVESLLLFSRPPPIECKREDLGALVGRAVGRLSDLATERGVKVSVELPPGLEIQCDGHKIQQVVGNLVKNAIEAARTVDVRLAAEDSDLVLEVSDDGPGLSDEAKKHLFEAFFTTKPNGTGLGLPTSMRYVQAHGGTLRAGAAHLGGALFRVALPKEQKRE